MRAISVVVAILSVASPAMSADTPYLDDRSDPAGLIKSLYNAIERKEYARAWSYFSTKPAANLEAYAAGYADTVSVRAVVGVPSEEGAAGSIHYYLPVAIEASSANGDRQIFGGCYELRLANPQVQAEDFVPLHIERGSFSRSSGLLEGALPATCNDGPPPAPGQLYEQRAKALFRDTFGQRCNVPDRAAPENRFASYAVQPSGGSEIHIYRFLCGWGAYNEGHIYMMTDRFGEVSVLSFATPDLDIRYQDDDHEKPVESINVIGFRTAQELVNSDFDPATLTLTSFAKWRGLGDASSVGTWILREGEFSLTRYDVDASYDGEINPETVIDYHSGP